MWKALPFFLMGFFFGQSLMAQRPLIKVPRENISSDSLSKLIYLSIEPDPKTDKDGIASMRQYGWLKPSEPFGTDSFWLFTKNWCIERVGEERFYNHFRLDYYSLKEDFDKKTYRIRYYFYPFDSTKTELTFDLTDYSEITFLKTGTSDSAAIILPESLPDIRQDSIAYGFRLDAAAVRKLVSEHGFSNNISLQLGADQNWQIVDSGDGWLRKTFTLNSRTGIFSKITESRRID